MGLHALKLGIGGILMYSATISAFFIVMLMSQGSVSEARNELSGTGFINTFLAIDAGIILMITGLMHYDRQLPGGKYFRTVKGGFDTYRKMKNASLIARVTALIAILIFGAFSHLLGVFKLSYGISDIIYIGAFLLLSIGEVNFMNYIKNPALRGFLTPFIIFATGLPGVILPNVFDGNIYIGLAVAAVAVPFILISQKAMLSDYKKNKWNQ
ncbi:MAG: hypothetical protein IKO47_12980 [Ruminococcus sp.]|nr:hypothetical protein [Ruminococcus sp.]